MVRTRYQLNPIIGHEYFLVANSEHLIIPKYIIHITTDKGTPKLSYLGVPLLYRIARSYRRSFFDNLYSKTPTVHLIQFTALRRPTDMPYIPYQKHPADDDNNHENRCDPCYSFTFFAHVHHSSFDIQLSMSCFVHPSLSLQCSGTMTS